MSEVCKSAAPPYAIRMWANERSIFAELPSINGPYVAEFPRTEGGLSKALHELGAMCRDSAGEPYTRPDPLIPNARLAKDNITRHDLESARDVLKKAGLLK